MNLSTVHKTTSCDYPTDMEVDSVSCPPQGGFSNVQRKVSSEHSIRTCNERDVNTHASTSNAPGSFIPICPKPDDNQTPIQSNFKILAPATETDSARYVDAEPYLNNGCFYEATFSNPPVIRYVRLGGCHCIEPCSPFTGCKNPQNMHAYKKL